MMSGISGRTTERASVLPYCPGFSGREQSCMHTPIILWSFEFVSFCHCSAVPEIVAKEVDSDDAALGPLPIKEEYSRVSKVQRIFIKKWPPKWLYSSNSVHFQAQKRREKKALKEKERLEEIENQEELNKSGPRFLEQEALRQKLTERKLQIKEVGGSWAFIMLSSRVEILKHAVDRQKLVHGI